MNGLPSLRSFDLGAPLQTLLTLRQLKINERAQKQAAEIQRERLKVIQQQSIRQQELHNIKLADWDKQARFAKGRYLLKSMEDLIEKVTTGPETGGLETISQEDYTDFLDRLRDFDVDVSGLPSTVSDDIVKDLKDGRDELTRQLEAQGAIEEQKDERHIIVGKKLYTIPKAASLEIFKGKEQRERMVYDRRGEPFPVWYEKGAPPVLPEGWSWGKPEEKTELERARTAFVAGTASPAQIALLKLGIKPEYTPGQALEKVAALERAKATFNKTGKIDDMMAMIIPDYNVGDKLSGDEITTVNRAYDRAIEYVRKFTEGASGERTAVFEADVEMGAEEEDLRAKAVKMLSERGYPVTEPNITGLIEMLKETK